MRRAEHEVAVAAGQHHVAVRGGELGAERGAGAPAAGRAAAAEVGARLRAAGEVAVAPPELLSASSSRMAFGSSILPSW